MSEVKVPCTKCGAAILPITAERTGGLCMPCFQGRKNPAVLSPEAASAELAAAAGALETRAVMLRVPSQRIRKKEWSALAPHLRKHVPKWLRDTLSQYALYGIALEYSGPGDGYDRIFSFAGPEDYNQTLQEGSIYFQLLDHGHLVIGFEADGNMWTLEAPFEPGSKVFLFDYSAWDGCTPTKDNGFTFAASRLSLLLSTMGISPVSYGSRQTSLLWYVDYEPPRAE